MTNRPKRTGLGRGLSALLPGADAQTEADVPVDEAAPVETPSEAAAMGLAEIDVGDIHPNPRQPRSSFRQDELDELSASIREHGVLQPVLVRPRAQGGYELLGGERRLRASKLAGATRVPAIIREVDDRQALEQAVVENVQRADLDPLEEASAYRNLIDLFELTQEDTARRVGKSRVHVTNMLRLLELPEEIKAFVADGRLQAGHARALLQFRDNEKRVAVARRAVDKGLTVRQIEELARTDSGERATSEREPRMRRYPDLEESLGDHLGTDVRIEAGRGKGRVVISFGDREDLHRIVELLLGY
jgi:ParB family transcriptional regulator, chromosome partitioning protein